MHRRRSLALLGGWPPHARWAQCLPPRRKPCASAWARWCPRARATTAPCRRWPSAGRRRRARAPLHRLHRRHPGRGDRHGPPHARRPAEGRADLVVGLAEIDRSVTALQYMPMLFRDWRRSTTCSRRCASSSRRASWRRASSCCSGATPAGCATSPRSRCCARPTSRSTSCGPGTATGGRSIS